MLEIQYYFTPMLDHLESFDQNDWHLHPIVTLPTAKQLRDAEKLPKNVTMLNACYDRLQKISLDYLTVNLYGRRQGRRFLLKLQEALRTGTVLDYTGQVRQQLLTDLGVTTSDFMTYRAFAKKHLKLILQDYHAQGFENTPAALVLTDETCLKAENESHFILQNYLHQIEKTA